MSDLVVTNLSQIRFGISFVGLQDKFSPEFFPMAHDPQYDSGELSIKNDSIRSPWTTLAKHSGPHEFSDACMVVDGHAWPTCHP